MSSPFGAPPELTQLINRGKPYRKIIIGLSADENVELIKLVMKIDATRKVNDGNLKPMHFKVITKYDNQNGFGALLRENLTCEFQVVYGEFDPKHHTIMNGVIDGNEP